MEKSKAIENAKKYLRSRYMETSSFPHLHKNTAKVYTQLLEIIENQPERYEEAAGDFSIVQKAEAMDRYTNIHSLAARIHYEAISAAAATSVNALSETKGYSALNRISTEAATRDANASKLEYSRRDALSAFLQSILSWRASPSQERPGRAEAVRNALTHLKELDKDFTWNKITNHPPYRNSIYFTSAHFSLMNSWLNEIGVGI